MVEWPAACNAAQNMAHDVAEHIARVRERMAAACQRSGRRPEDVRLIAISKTVSPDRIRLAYDAGIREFGENRVQEAAAKRPALSDLTVTWHLVGHLQSNKAKPARELFRWVHSLDSQHLAERLDKAAPCRSDRLPVLIEVNLGGEETKAGVSESEVAPLVEAITKLETIAVCGLMVIPPFLDDPEQARPYFQRLRKLAIQIGAKGFPNVSMEELSMGMSHDFEVAIEEGATMIRVGTAIFGPRE
jgi:hypothetical protein